MRRAFVDTLIEMAAADERVVLLTGDLGYQVFDRFIARFGRRYVNVGIAESQLVNASAGLAMEGFRPIAYSIASFMTGRPYEQIRFCAAYPHLPVMIVGAGGGYCYADAGVSHHAVDDFALMCLQPGMTVVSPGDPAEVRALLPQLLTIDGPSYIRIGKFGEPAFDSPAPIALAKARLLQAGRRVAIISLGEMACAVLEAARSLAAEGLQPAVCHFHTIKPLDERALDDLSAAADAWVVVEEACPLGGLHSAILAWRDRSGRPVKIVRLGPGDEFALGSPSRQTLRDRFGFGAAAIAAKVREMF